MASSEEYQPRFVAYAAATGRRPEDIVGPRENIRFILWIRERWEAWAKTKGAASIEALRPLSDAQHVEFDGWLQAQNQKAA